MINDYPVIKTKRKSLGISIKYDGSVIIRAPLKVSRSTINKFIDKHRSWIEAKLSKINAVKTQQASENLFYYLGQRYPLNETQEKIDLIKFDGTQLLIQAGQASQTETILSKWYRLQARQLIEPLIQEYAYNFGFRYSALKITAAKNRWGSCSNRGSICFSYRIAMLPIEVISYIAAHELAHLKHLNHSSAFWREVEYLYPNYKTAYSWLNKHKYLLAVCS